MLKYKGFTAIFEIDFKNNLICGRVIGIKDVLSFHGITPKEAEESFHITVDHYLDWIKEDEPT